MKSCYVDKATRSIADLCDYYGKGMLLTRINVPKASRGKGHASALLTRILDDADEEGVTLFLEISPSDGLDYSQLEAWYHRHGFKSIGLLLRRKPDARDDEPRRKLTRQERLEAQADAGRRRLRYARLGGAMKLWWVRLVGKSEGYGTWVPTGCTDRREAGEYVRFYLANVLPVYDQCAVREWLQL